MFDDWEELEDLERLEDDELNLSESKKNKIHELFLQEFGPMEEDTVMSIEQFHKANMKLLSELEEE